MNLFVELGDSAQGLLKLLDSVSQPLVGLLQMLASGCQVFGILVELCNLLRGFLIGLQALIEAAVSELKTPIPDQPFLLGSSHLSDPMSTMQQPSDLNSKRSYTRMRASKELRVSRVKEGESVMDGERFGCQSRLA